MAYVKLEENLPSNSAVIGDDLLENLAEVLRDKRDQFLEEVGRQLSSSSWGFREAILRHVASVYDHYPVAFGALGICTLRSHFDHQLAKRVLAEGIGVDEIFRIEMLVQRVLTKLRLA